MIRAGSSQPLRHPRPTNMSNPRYHVIGTAQENDVYRLHSYKIFEPANTAEEANLLYDIMLADESMVGPVEVIDLASGKRVRYSLDENEQPL